MGSGVIIMTLRWERPRTGSPGFTTGVWAAESALTPAVANLNASVTSAPWPPGPLAPWPPGPLAPWPPGTLTPDLEGIPCAQA